MTIDPADCPHPFADVRHGICTRCDMLLLVELDIEATCRLVLTVEEARERFEMGDGPAGEVLPWLRVLVQGLPALLRPLLEEKGVTVAGLPRLTRLNGKNPPEWRKG